MELPRGKSTGKLDDKGRLKLSAPNQDFFRSLSEKKLFVTTLNGRTAVIYPIAAWRENEKLFENFRENPKAMKKVLFMAQDMGSEAEMDGQGRLQLEAELRRELKLEGTQLHLIPSRGHIEIFTDEQYKAMKEQPGPELDDAIDIMERAGMR